MAGKKTDCWGFTGESLLLGRLQAKSSSGAARTAKITVQASKGKKATQVQRIVEGEKLVDFFLNPLAAVEGEHESRLKTSDWSRVRDAVGGSLGIMERMEIGEVEYAFSLDEDLLEAALVGLEIALYRFKRVLKGEASKVALRLTNKGKAISEKTVQASVIKGTAVNLARHLVNLPPNMLNPVTYAEALQALMPAGIKVEIWDEKKLAAEKMNLHLAVGQASDTPPRLVRLRYRPAGGGKSPVAFVGKGITFDSGGLDIKPSSGMRLMKKDMGGSATIAGLAWWAATSKVKTSMDFYLALAENSIGGNAFRPSDILTSRHGTTVEIHNTDAEGRLVLADAMDVAVTASEKPRYLIDVATLTGAIKVALGANLAGLFSSDPKLAQAIATKGQEVGDLTWIMPLFQKYRSSMNSVFADQVNSVDGFGGAITAALFLEKFARDIPWAHLDIYAWKDSAEGAWLESGGNGQSVLGLAQWVEGLK